MNLSDWPVARRLFAVIVAALLMGVIFGGLRVADAVGSASQFSRTEQLAKLSAKLITVVDDLQHERDQTLVALVRNNPAGLRQLQAKTDSDLVPVREALKGIAVGGFPQTIAVDASAVNNDLSKVNIGALHNLFNTATADGVAVSSEYQSLISAIITLQDQVSLGITDTSLTSDVQTLNALSQAKELTSQQLALLDQSLSNVPGSGFAKAGFLPFETETKLQVAFVEELNEEALFQASATQQEQLMFDSKLGPQADRLNGEDVSQNIEQAFFTVAGGGAGNPHMIQADGISLPLFIKSQPLDPNANSPTTAKQDGITTVAKLKSAWDTGTNATLGAMQDAEGLVVGNIVTRATQLQQAAQRTALTYGVITAVVLLIVLLAALAVARSLVLPLRRLRAGALDIASVQLPERVRLLSESPEAAEGMVVAPVNVASQDEIGQVARAFDQVHSEAVRLAGEQAVLRTSFNAMFVNLSRRSQSLIERLARMIDILEQNEDDPDRLGNLFSMDHLVTRMRRNSENLLLLAGHENPRKWSESIPLADVARAATSEIEQYNRVVLNVPPGISVIGQAVSDVVHLLAELIENATIFSPKDTQVSVAMQELASGGVLIEVLDKGIGVSEARLADMNWRLDNPPTIDVSVSRHMGLFAVARLAERHRVRVRLRPASPQGLSALVWLPDTVLERSGGYAASEGWSGRPAGAQANLGGRQAVAPAASTMTMTGQAARGASGWFRGRAIGGDTGMAHGGGEFGPAMDWGDGRRPGDIVADPAYGDQTTAGLPVRVPKANLIPGAAPAWPAAPGAAAGQARDGGEAGQPAAGRDTGAGSGKRLPQRSPEQARSRLAGFQRGTRRAEGKAGQPGKPGQSPRSGEGSSR